MQNWTFFEFSLKSGDGRCFWIFKWKFHNFLLLFPLLFIVNWIPASELIKLQGERNGLWNCHRTWKNWICQKAYVEHGSTPISYRPNNVTRFFQTLPLLRPLLLHCIALAYSSRFRFDLVSFCLQDTNNVPWNRYQ